ncbi:hypothetical protein Unana1_01292 [Umbelopsis nana]
MADFDTFLKRKVLLVQLVMQTMTLCSVSVLKDKKYKVVELRSNTASQVGRTTVAGKASSISGYGYPPTVPYNDAKIKSTKRLKTAVEHEERWIIALQKAKTLPNQRSEMAFAAAKTAPLPSRISSPSIIPATPTPKTVWGRGTRPRAVSFLSMRHLSQYLKFSGDPANPSRRVMMVYLLAYAVFATSPPPPDAEFVTFFLTKPPCYVHTPELEDEIRGYIGQFGHVLKSTLFTEPNGGWFQCRGKVVLTWLISSVPPRLA